MENKYYTPKIEEFHVGFEYEYRIKGEDWKNNESDEVACDLECDEITQIRLDLANSQIRVKYLDEQDIISFGAIIEWRSKIGGVTFNLPTTHRGDKATVGIYYTPQTSHLLLTLTNNYILDTTIFTGIVKNKSELKRLMDMLQINP